MEELCEERGESAHQEEMATRCDKTPGTIKYTKPFSNVFVSIDTRKRNAILAVDYVSKRSLSLDSLEVYDKDLTHHCSHGEDDGVMERLFGMPCYLCHAATSNERTPGWLDLVQQGSASIQTASFSACVPSKVTLEEPRLFSHCWTM